MTGASEQSPEGSVEQDLLIEIEAGVARLTMNRPDVLNALTAAHFDQLTATFDRLSRDDEVRVIVLTGAGKAFSAGGDLKTLNREVLLETAHANARTAAAMRGCLKPVIAEVNGDAVGGGNELVILADMAVAAESARLGQAGTRLGWAPIIGGTTFLSMSVGDKRAREITFFSKVVPAAVAEEWGWVNRVVPDDRLRAEVDEWCRELILRSPGGLRLAKSTANVWWDMSITAMMAGLAQMEAGVTDETITAGKQAFFEKRPAEWPR